MADVVKIMQDLVDALEVGSIPPSSAELGFYGTNPFGVPLADDANSTENIVRIDCGPIVWIPVTYIPSVDLTRYPHKCGCGAPGYQGAGPMRCSDSKCANAEFPAKK